MAALKVTIWSSAFFFNKPELIICERKVGERRSGYVLDFKRLAVRLVDQSLEDRIMNSVTCAYDVISSKRKQS